MKRLLTAGLVAVMAFGAWTGAGTAQADDNPIGGIAELPACNVEYVTGDECQGLDNDSRPGVCKLADWVGSATCELDIPGGVVNKVYVQGHAWADDPDLANITVTVRDPASGEVFFSMSATGDSPKTVGFPGGLTEPIELPVRHVSLPGGGQSVTNLDHAADTVLCEITGTHSVTGGATNQPDPFDFDLHTRNRLSCTVNNGQ